MATPAVTATTYSCHSVRTPSAQANGTDPMISTRATSQASMIPRLVCRSTSAPAGRAMSANAAVAADVSRPTSKVLALSRTTAVSGSAS